jgi:hypothetical protein
VQSGYKEVFSSMKWSDESSFGTPACRDELGSTGKLNQGFGNWQLQNNGKKGVRL